MSALAVELERVSFQYPGGARPALCDVSLRIEPGTITVVAGRTGSGKSTLLRLLAGWIPRFSSGLLTGQARLLDQDVRDSFPAGMIGYVLQSPDDQLCTTSVEAEVAFGLENLSLSVSTIAARVDEALERCGLSTVRDRHPQQLSGGQKQRLVLASILAMRPRLIVLDEPLSQLDPRAASELIELLCQLKRQGMTLIVAEHRLHELQPIADRVVPIDEGSLRTELPSEWSAALESRFRAPSVVTRAAASEPPVLIVERLSYRYPRATHPLLLDVSLRLSGGERVALVGPNGSGKSTLLAVLAESSRHALCGRIEVCGAPRVAWGFVPQNADLLLFNDTVFDELAYTPRRLRWSAAEIDQRVRELARRLELEPQLDVPPLALSQGQRWRVALAAVLAARPQCLLLDEPTTGQDPGQIARLAALLRHEMQAAHDESTGLRAVLFSTHDRRLVAEFAERVLVLADGRLQADVGVEPFLHDERWRQCAGWRTFDPSEAR